MELGLRILIQLVLEFAPVIAALVQKRKDFIYKLPTTKDIPFKEIPELIQNVSSLISTSNLLGKFEQTKLRQQQLAVYHRQTQFKLAEQER